MSEMTNWKNVSRSWKRGFRKKAACVLVASTVFLLTSCHQQRVIVRDRVVEVPERVIDTAFVFVPDTTYIIETDTFRIETVIRDTLIRQKITTKPIYIHRTDTVESAEFYQLKAENEKLKELEQRDKAAVWIFVIILVLGAIFGTMGILRHKR